MFSRAQADSLLRGCPTGSWREHTLRVVARLIFRSSGTDNICACTSSLLIHRSELGQDAARQRTSTLPCSHDFAVVGYASGFWLSSAAAQCASCSIDVCCRSGRGRLSEFWLGCSAPPLACRAGDSHMSSLGLLSLST